MQLLKNKTHHNDVEKLQKEMLANSGEEEWG